MGIIVLLIFISLIIAVGFLISFLWNVKSGQYEDTFTPSVRMLFDDDPTPTSGAVGESEDPVDRSQPAKTESQAP